MARRYERYVMRDGQTRLGQEYFNPIWLDIDNRIVILEDLGERVDRGVEDLVQFGIRRVDEYLAPAYQNIASLAELGFLTATLEGDAPLLFAEGETTVIIKEGPERDQFRPAPFLTFQVGSDYEKVAVALTTAYNRANGALVVDIVAVTSALENDPGPHTGVFVASASGSAIASAKALEDAKAIRTQVFAARDVALGARDAALGARDAALNAKQDTLDLRAETLALRNQAGAFRDQAANSAAVAATFEPSAFYTKGQTDGLLTALAQALDEDMDGVIEAVDALAAKIPGGAQTRSISSGVTLSANDKRVQIITSTTADVVVSFPDATTLTEGGPKFLIRNAGARIMRLADFSGKLLASIRPGQVIAAYLDDGSTQAGSWTLMSENRISKVYTFDPIAIGTAVSNPFGGLGDAVFYGTGVFSGGTTYTGVGNVDTDGENAASEIGGGYPSGSSAIYGIVSRMPNGTIGAMIEYYNGSENRTRRGTVARNGNGDWTFTQLTDASGQTIGSQQYLPICMTNGVNVITAWQTSSNQYIGLYNPTLIVADRCSYSYMVRACPRGQDEIVVVQGGGNTGSAPYPGPYIRRANGSGSGWVGAALSLGTLSTTSPYPWFMDVAMMTETRAVIVAFATNPQGGVPQSHLRVIDYSAVADGQIVSTVDLSAIDTAFANSLYGSGMNFAIRALSSTILLVVTGIAGGTTNTPVGYVVRLSSDGLSVLSVEKTELWPPGYDVLLKARGSTNDQPNMNLAFTKASPSSPALITGLSKSGGQAYITTTEIYP